MKQFPEVREGVRIRLTNGQRGRIVSVVPKQLVAEGDSRGVARVKLDGDGEKDVDADGIAAVVGDGQ